jgi:hypothetical protein
MTEEELDKLADLVAIKLAKRMQAPIPNPYPQPYFPQPQPFMPYPSFPGYQPYNPNIPNPNDNIVTCGPTLFSPPGASKD